MLLVFWAIIAQSSEEADGLQLPEEDVREKRGNAGDSFTEGAPDTDFGQGTSGKWTATFGPDLTLSQRLTVSQSTQSRTTAVSSETNGDPNSGRKDALSAGAVAGIVIASLVGVAICAFAAYRIRMKALEVSASTSSSESSGFSDGSRTSSSPSL
jgi:hypothetical protein